MNLTPDQIPLLIKLQPFFKEKWNVGDMCYDKNYNRVGFIIDTPQRNYRYLHVVFISGVEAKYKDKNELLHIPQPLDPECSGRCLVKMINNFCDLFLRKDGIWVCRYWDKNKKWDLATYQAADPYTALLKAICEQEGL